MTDQGAGRALVVYTTRLGTSMRRGKKRVGARNLKQEAVGTVKGDRELRDRGSMILPIDAMKKQNTKSMESKTQHYFCNWGGKAREETP